MRDGSVVGGGFGGVAPSALKSAVGLIDQITDDGADWFVYTPGEVVLSVRGLLGEMQRLAFLPRRLSRNRLMGVVRPFIHPKSPFDIDLPTPSAAPMSLSGAVSDCVYAATGVHAVTLQLAKPVDVHELCGPDARPTREPAGAGDTPAKPEFPLGGDLLAIIPDPEEWEELERELEKAGASYERAPMLGMGLDRLRQKRFAAVLTDSEFGEIKLSGVLQRIVATDYMGPVLVLDFDDASERDASLPKHKVLFRPPNAQTLTEAVRAVAPAP